MQEKEDKVFYKIEAGKKYRVFKTVFDDKVYYRIQISQKMYDGTTKKWYKQIVFKKGINLDNETDIIIHEAYENLRENKNDSYNPVSYLTITDFEIVERQEQIEENAYLDYQNKLSENENENDIDVMVDDSFLD